MLSFIFAEDDKKGVLKRNYNLSDNGVDIIAAYAMGLKYNDKQIGSKAEILEHVKDMNAANNMNLQQEELHEVETYLFDKMLEVIQQNKGQNVSR